jgi:hypothetical protein
MNLEEMKTYWTEHAEIMREGVSYGISSGEFLLEQGCAEAMCWAYEILRAITEWESWQ